MVFIHKENLMKSECKVLMKMIILFFLFVLIYPVFGEASQTSFLYIPKIENKTNNTLLAEKIQNIISLKALPLSKGKFNIFDSEMENWILKHTGKQQKLGCSTDSCSSILTSLLEPEFVIIASLSYESEKTYSISLKLQKYDKVKFTLTLENQVIAIFKPEEIDFVLEESLIKLFNKTYQMKRPIPSSTEVFPEITPSKKENLKSFKEAFGNNIIPETLLIIQEYERKALELFEKEKYKESAELNVKIKDSIMNSSGKDNLEKLNPILQTLDYNISTAYSEYFQKRIKDVNLIKLEKKEERKTHLDFYEEVFKEYTDLRSNIQNLEQRRFVENKIVYSILVILQLKDKEGDDAFQKFDFQLSQKIYNEILLSLESYSFHPEIQKAKLKLQKKMEQVNQAGTMLLYSRVKSYSDLSEKQILKANLMKNIDGDLGKANQFYSEAENAILGAEKEIQSLHTFLNEDTRILFNHSLEKLKSNKKDISLEPILRPEQKNRLELQNKKTIVQAMEIFLPGSGRVYFDRKEGYLVTGVFLLSLYYTYTNHHSFIMQENRTKEYQQNQWVSQYLYFSSPTSNSNSSLTYYRNPIYPFLTQYYASQYAESEGKIETLNINRNLGMISLVLIYFWNISDLTSPKHNYFSLTPGFQWNLRWIPSSFDRSRDSSLYQFGFSYHF